jgi:hypothetical protein
LTHAQDTGGVRSFSKKILSIGSAFCSGVY